MSKEILEVAASRINDYVEENSIDRIAVVYHGGEPLLLGAKALAQHAIYLRNLISSGIIIDFSLQTNGVLLKESDLKLFEQCGLQVSLSIDGGPSANDRHRLDHKGKSTFKDTENALRLLESYPHVFAGVIAVIDPHNDPSELLSFFDQYNIPQLDFLLPDANYITLPPHRGIQADIYENWLINCFDLWFDHYSSLKIRTFDSILASLLGAPSETDGFGFGDVGLITVETDGSYHDLDVLKITGAGTNLTRGDVRSTTISHAIGSENVQKHRELLRKEGLCLTCQECSVVEICGGGAVAHRYSEHGFINPSIYCRELKGLIEHAHKRVSEQVEMELETIPAPRISDGELEEYETKTGMSNALINVLSAFKDNQSELFCQTISQINKPEYLEITNAILSFSPEIIKHISINPAIVAWTEVLQRNIAGNTARSVDGDILPVDLDYLKTIFKLGSEFHDQWPSLQSQDQWLRLPFGNRVYFENAARVDEAKEVINKAIELIWDWKSSIIDEMSAISPDILFIRDLDAPLDRVVSFSDNTVPGALYVQLMKNHDFIEPADLADSIIHEHRHQKLYLLQRVCPIVNADYPLIASPWREELRPPSGLFHALYVFIELLDFWKFLSESDKYIKQRQIAMKNCDKIHHQLTTGFDVVKNCDLTPAGHILISYLEEKHKSLTNIYEDK